MSAQLEGSDRGPEEILAVEDADGVRTLTFNRPEAANAFNHALYRATAAALRDAAGDDTVACVVVTGRGKTFSSGTDLVEMAALVADLDNAPGSGAHPFGEFLDVLAEFPKPLLAAVNGAGVGLGLTMLLHCDLVLMAAGSRLRVPFSAMGVAPEAASSYLLPQRVGRQHAAHTLFTSRWVSAEEAVGQGLALRVCPPASLLDETMEIARSIAVNPVASLVAIKKLLLDAERDGVQRARQGEDAAFAELLRRPDAGAGVSRQLEGSAGSDESKG